MTEEEVNKVMKCNKEKKIVKKTAFSFDYLNGKVVNNAN